MAGLCEHRGNSCSFWKKFPADISASEEYVFDIMEASDRSYFFCSLSNNKISIFDSNLMGSDFQKTPICQSINAHTDRINCIGSVESNPNVIASSSSDHKIRVWDIRENASISKSNPCMEIKLENEVFSFAFGLNATLLGATNAMSVQFFDIRYFQQKGQANSSGSHHKHAYKPLYSYDDLHSDTITSIKFRPSNPAHVVTAADDGLICVHDMTVADPDEVTISVMNTDCPVRSFGFFGENYEGIHCINAIETLSCWHVDSGVRIGAYNSIRDDLGVDYLVDCIYESNSAVGDANELLLICGKYDGAGVLCKLQPNMPVDTNHIDIDIDIDTYMGVRIDGGIGSVDENVSQASVGYFPVGTLTGHEAMIRCVCKVNPHSMQSWQSRLLITGGEDGQLCLWNYSLDV